MANEYFNFDVPFNKHTLARSEQVNAVFQAVEDGFDKLPSPGAVAQGRITYVVDEGVTDSYVVAMPVPPPSYMEGLGFVMKAANANVGPSVINVNGLGVRQIRRYTGGQLLPGDIQPGAMVQLTYNGQHFIMVGQHGGEAAVAKISADQAAASAQAASSSASSANADKNTTKGYLDFFRGTYYGPLAADPVLDPNGHNPTEGDWYYNTTTKAARQFDGAAWGDLGKAAMRAFAFTAEGSETELSGPDDFGNALAYTPGLVKVYKNGVRLTAGQDYSAVDGAVINGLAPLSAADVITIDAFSAFTIYAEDAAAERLWAIIEQFQAGYTGFEDGHLYDFGLITDPNTFFDRDYGGLS